MSVQRWVGSVWVACAFASVVGCQCGDAVSTAVPSITVTPDPVVLGQAELGSTSAAYVEVRNDGRATLVLTEFALEADPGAEAGDLDAFELQAVFAKSCTGAARAEWADGATIEQGGCARAVVSFAPWRAGVHSAVLVVTSNATTEPVRVAVRATGTAASLRACVLTPSSEVDEAACSVLGGESPVVPTIDVGEVPRGTSASRVLRLFNDGDATMRLVSALFDPETAPFSVPADAAAPWSGGEFHDLEVKFAPVAGGAFEASLELQTNAPNGLFVAVPVKGVGVLGELRACVGGAAGEVDVSACTDRVAGSVPSIDFGAVPVGSTVERVLHLDNPGRAALALLGGGLDPSTGDFAVPGGVTSGALAAGATALVRVSFAPSTIGAQQATLTVSSDDERFGSLVIPVRGQGAAPQLRACVLRDDGQVDAAWCTDFSVDPPVLPEVAFGALVLGDSKVRTVRIFNDGDAVLQVAETALANASVDFTVPTPFVGEVAAGAFTDVGVRFEPTTEPEQGGLFVVRSNALGRASLALNLRGSGLGPKVCVEPAGTIDFGSVPAGLVRTLPVTVRNCGPIALSLTVARLDETDGHAGDLSLVGVPALPTTLAPGDTRTFDVRYAPRAQRTDAGTVVVTASGITVTRAVTGVGAPATCQSAPSLANAGPDQTVGPQVTVTLDGRGSSTPRGGALTYTWRLASQPTNGRDALSSTSVVRPTIVANLAGEYVFELVVRDSANCQSAPDQVTVRVVPPTKVHVQLTWAEDYGDVDLHYIGPGGSFGTRGDVYFGNKTPDWGSGNAVGADGIAANNPSLDKDEVWGRGPENLNHTVPFNGSYQVVVHGYCQAICLFGFCGSSYGTMRPTVKVFLDGTQVWSHTFDPVSEKHRWLAGNVIVSSNGQSVQWVPSATRLSDSSTSATCQLF